MNDVIQYVPAGILGLLAIGLLRMMNGRLKGKVSKGECHHAQDAVKDKIEGLERHIDTRIEDLKDFIKENGTR